MKVSELISRLQTRPADEEVVIFIGDTQAEQYPVQGVGSIDPKNGEPTKSAVVGFTVT